MNEIISINSLLLGIFIGTFFTSLILYLIFSYILEGLKEEGKKK
jgi:hypothetical protein